MIDVAYGANGASRPSRRTVLLTGVAGFIGSHTAERLLERGDRVLGLDNFDPFYPEEQKRRNLRGALAHPNFRLIEGDCADPDTFEKSINGVRPDVIVHLAAKAGVRPSIEDPLGYNRANVIGTQVMLDFARTRRIERFVFASSSSVYGDSTPVPFAEEGSADLPISPYAASKRSGELMCHTYHHLYGIGVLALRFFTVYGPRQRPDLAIRKFTTLMLEGRPVPIFGDGTTARDYTWIDDIVQGVVAAVDRTERVPKEFAVVNLGGSQTTSLSRMVGLIADSLQVSPTIDRLPCQPGDVRQTYANLDRAREMLGYCPRMPIEEGIPRFVDWLKAEPTPV